MIDFKNYDYYISDEERLKFEQVQAGLSKDLTNLYLFGAYGKDKFPEVNLTDVDLSGSTLNNLIFEDMNFKDAIMSEVSLDGCTFVRCDFTRATIKSESNNGKGPNFIECSLIGCTLQLEAWDFSINFEGCDLSDSVFVKSDIAVAYFKNTKCENTDFTGLEYDLERAESLCFNGYNHEPRLIFNNANLKGAKFDGLSLNHAQFEGANLTDTSFKDCDLSSEEPLDMRCQSSSYFDYSDSTSFKGATLNNTNFEGANLSGAKNLMGFG